MKGDLTIFVRMGKYLVFLLYSGFWVIDLLSWFWEFGSFQMLGIVEDIPYKALLWLIIYSTIGMHEKKKLKVL